MTSRPKWHRGATQRQISDRLTLAERRLDGYDEAWAAFRRGTGDDRRADARSRLAVLPGGQAAVAR